MTVNTVKSIERRAKPAFMQRVNNMHPAANQAACNIGIISNALSNTMTAKILSDKRAFLKLGGLESSKALTNRKSLRKRY